MFDLISIGNISIDLYFQGTSLTQTSERFNLAVGGKYTADHFYSGLGGGGTNVAIGVARHKHSVAVVGKIGNNQFKSMILRHLAQHNISNKLCTFKDDYTKISSILLSASGERTIINYETPHDHIFDNPSEVHKLKEARMVYFSSLPHVSLEERDRVMGYVNKQFIPLILNLGVVDCRRPISQIEHILSKVTVLILNAYEFCEMAKIPLKNIDFKKDIRNHIPPLLDKVLIVTDGGKGSHAYFKTEILHVKAIKAKRVVDTTGAGDAFTAGFISGYLDKEDVFEAMNVGSKYAVKIVEKLGAN